VTIQTAGVSVGNGTVDLVAAALRDGGPRAGTITIAGKAVDISQAAACTVNLTPQTIYAPARGGAFTVSVTSACRWEASSAESWARALNFPGAVHVSVDPNFATRTRVATMQIGSQTLHVTQAPSTSSQPERLTDLVFFQLFGRPAKPDDVFAWAAPLMNDPSSAIQALFTSGETALRSRYVIALYRALLNRAPEFGGWVLQRNALAALDAKNEPAAARDDLVKNFLRSTEFTLINGQPDDVEYIRILYRQILGREPSPSEISFHVRSMRGSNSIAGEADRVAKARDMLLVPEFATKIDVGTTALLLHYALLLRGGQPSEIRGIEAKLHSGTSLQEIIREIISTAEFRNLYE
jgi:hypothetical protein